MIISNGLEREGWLWVEFCEKCGLYGLDYVIRSKIKSEWGWGWDGGEKWGNGGDGCGGVECDGGR